MTSTKSSHPITELANELTTELDTVSSIGLVRLLRQCSSQVFQGWHELPSISDTPVLDTMYKATRAIHQILHSTPDGVVVMTGCGTSGRIAYFVARTLNKVLTDHGLRPCLRYLISGGDSALLLSNELPEDDPELGKTDLQQILGSTEQEQNTRPFVLIGITCGLSAPYVAGQISYALECKNALSTILMGFNPEELARDHLIEQWNNRTFRQVVEHLSFLRSKEPMDSFKYLVLNPIVGPEAVTGSSRMKGGTATKVLLETMITAAIPKDNTKLDRTKHARTIEQYTHACRAAYMPIEDIAKVVTACGSVLKNNGHIYYIGMNELGVMAFIDASEMPDTYGTPHDNVRAFVRGGWKTMGNVAGDLTDSHHLFQISWQHFTDVTLPTLSASDIVIGLCCDSELPNVHKLLQTCSSSPAATAMIHLTVKSPDSKSEIDQAVSFAKSFTYTVHVDMSQLKSIHILADSSAHKSAGDYSLLTSAAKWILNVISTGANVHYGMVRSNRMINLTVANNKLFYRSIGIIAAFAQCSEKEARNAMLCTIYGLSELTPEIDTATISSHVIAATPLVRVIPRSIELVRSHQSS
jgi:N-acetylmuramic acid 6-phosphate (MurNAc-6-P) etherase